MYRYKKYDGLDMFLVVYTTDFATPGVMGYKVLVKSWVMPS
jgi:hypothetical protein